MLQLDAPGPASERRLAPKIIDTARFLWVLYVALTGVCMLSYKCLGMSWFEACCEAFSTISTGGFSIYQESLAHYQLVGLGWVASLFMIAGAVSFSVHYAVWMRRDYKAYWRHVESCALLKGVLGITCVILIIMVMQGALDWHMREIEPIWFTATAMLTTTGLKVTEFSHWPTCLPLLLVLCGVIGGCSGSTTGGIKLGRALLIRDEALCALKRLMHPNIVCHVPSQHRAGGRQDVEIYGFLTIFLMFYCFLLLVFMLTGYDFYAAFSAITACLSNVGAGIGPIAHGYYGLHNSSKVILMIAMLAGRLEIMILLVCCLPSFWQHR